MGKPTLQTSICGTATTYVGLNITRFFGCCQWVFLDFFQIFPCFSHKIIKTLHFSGFGGLSENTPQIVKGGGIAAVHFTLYFLGGIHTIFRRAVARSAATAVDWCRLFSLPLQTSNRAGRERREPTARRRAEGRGMIDRAGAKRATRRRHPTAPERPAEATAEWRGGCGAGARNISNNDWFKYRTLFCSLLPSLRPHLPMINWSRQRNPRGLLRHENPTPPR